MKYVVIAGGGMSGLPIPRLYNQTCLKKADKPAMDTAARDGVTGVASLAGSGYENRRDASVFALLGYQPKFHFPGLAGLLAARLGKTPLPGEHFFACDLLTLEVGRILSMGGMSLPEIEARELVNSLNEGLTDSDASLIYCEGGTHLLVFRKDGEFRVRTNRPFADPSTDIKGLLPRGKDENLFLNFMDRARNILKDCDTNRVRVDLGLPPVNTAWPWEEMLPCQPDKTFSEKFGLRGLVICDSAFVAGAASLAGMECVLFPWQGTLGPENIEPLRDAAFNDLSKYDFIFIHTSIALRASLLNSVGGKSKVINEIDRLLVAPIMSQLDFSESRLMVLSDGCVSAMNGRDYPELVPFTMYGAGITSNGANGFSEIEAADTRLRFRNGWEILERFLK